MSARPLDIPARQVTALCKGAAKAGYVPVVKVGNAFVHLLPADSIQIDKVLGKAEADDPVDDEQDFRL